MPGALRLPTSSSFGGLGLNLSQDLSFLLYQPVFQEAFSLTTHLTGLFFPAWEGQPFFTEENPDLPDSEESFYYWYDISDYSLVFTRENSE